MLADTTLMSAKLLQKEYRSFGVMVDQLLRMGQSRQIAIKRETKAAQMGLKDGRHNEWKQTALKGLENQTCGERARFRARHVTGIF